MNSLMKWIYNTENTWNLISGRPGTLVLVQILFFDEIPNNMAIGGLVLVICAVLLQGFKDNDACLNIMKKSKIKNKNDI